MLTLLAVALIALSGVLVYKKRFTSDAKIRGMYFVQLYYLLITPIVCTLLLYLGLEIYKRPEVSHLPFSSDLLFILYSLSIIISGIGAGIHSTSTSVYQSFAKTKQFKGEAYDVNENFHGGLSHNLLFLGAIAGTVLLSFLEINHPSTRQLTILNTASVVGLGIFLGIIEAIGILRSLHIGYSLLGALTGSALIFFFARPFMLNTDMYPVSFVVLSSLITLFLSLALTVLIFILSGNLSRKILRRAYPQGHPFHDGISVKVLRIKIEREWL